MRLSVRAVPWLLAMLGLAVPLVGAGFMVWPLTVIWLVILVVIRLVGRAVLPQDRALRIGFGIAFLPILFLGFWEGGWWLIPADLAYLVIEWRDPAAARAADGHQPSGTRPGDIAAR
jgi:hypothetical protein